MLKVSMRMVRSGEEQRLRDWLSELMRRQDEVRETFEQETVRREQGYLLGINDGTALLYIVEADDLDQASTAYGNSKLPLDAEHRRVMGQTLGDRVPVELLYDVSIEQEVP